MPTTHEAHCQEPTGVGSTEEPVPLRTEDQEAVRKIYSELLARSPQLVGPDGETRKLPVSAYTFLLQLLADLDEGKSVAIMQPNAQLTTVQAARLLGMSRQFLVNLLERGEMPHHMVGSHRRLYAQDVFQYKLNRDRRRGAALNELAAAEMREGLYYGQAADD